MNFEIGLMHISNRCSIRNPLLRRSKLSLSHLAHYTGAIFSALSPNFEVHGVTSFVANQAKFYGGAISLTDPVHINIIDATFESNTATSGGAVSLTSTEGTSGGYENCRFGSNDASNGGALYLSTGGTGEVGGLSFVQHSAFHNNVAGESPSKKLRTGFEEVPWQCLSAVDFDCQCSNQ